MKKLLTWIFLIVPFLCLCCWPNLDFNPNFQLTTNATTTTEILPLSSVNQPNIILVISDDFGWPYASFMIDRLTPSQRQVHMGNFVVPTPNLDQLAIDGTVFPQGFSTASVCRPALQTLLTGVHPRVWDQHVVDTETALGHAVDYPTEVEHFLTLPRQLSRVGYRSYEGGKFWEGSAGMAGFDDGTQADISSCPELDKSCRDDFWGYFGRPSIQEMWDFIDEPDSRPFFIWFAPKLPHTPMDAGLPYPCYYWPVEYQQMWGCDPIQPEPDPPLDFDAVWYYANISRFDDLLGNLMSGLDTRGLKENTLIIYVSDNGFEQWAYEPCPDGSSFGCPKGKLSIHDLGFRTPIIFNQLNTVPSGVEFEEFLSFEDVYTTILEYAGAESVVDRRGIGVSELIQNGTNPTSLRGFLYGSQPHMTGVPRYFLLTNNWRYFWVQNEENYQALYHINDDLLEEINVVQDHPFVAAAAKSGIENWITEVTAPKNSLQISGRLTTHTGESMAGITMNLFGAIPWTAEITAEDGSFVFPPVSAGPYQILVRHVDNLTFDGESVENNRLTVNLSNRVLGPYIHFEADWE